MADTLEKTTRFEIHSVLKQANYDLQKLQFNTVASACMKILNALERFSGGRNRVTEEGLSILLRLLAPITPHVAHHLWRELDFGEDIMRADWPEPDPAALEQDEIEYVVQIAGKTRGNLRAPKTADDKALEALVRASDIGQRYIADRPVRKVIVVPGRLVGCGFQLRGSSNLPFDTIYVPGSSGGVALDLKRSIESSSKTRVVDNPKNAQAVFELSEAKQEKEILSLTGAGRVREYRLRYRVRYRVHDAKGRDLIPSTTLVQVRDVTFNDSQVLAKEAEDQLLYRDMQTDMVQQILRQLAAAQVKK